MKYLLLLALAACSGPSHLHYPPANPAPTYTPPGTGLPMPSFPGPGVRNIPRSPHKRVLPPSKEPGLWSADRPKASIIAPAPTLLGTTLPVPDAAKTPYISHSLSGCIEAAGELVGAPVFFTRIDALREDERKCFAGLLYSRCASGLPEFVKARRAKEGGSFNQSDAPALKALKKEAEAYVAKWCAGARADVERLGGEVGSVLSAVLKEASE